MKSKKPVLNKFFAIIFLTGVFMAFVLSTDPNKVALPLLVVPFILLGIILYQLTATALLFGKEGQKNSYLGKIIALSIASLGVGLLLLESLHQLTWRDSLLACVFAVLFWLYIWRADFLHR